MHPRFLTITALVVVLGVLIAMTAFAQDDEALEQELFRLTMQDESPAMFEHYRGRPTAATYELEVQMKHQDKLAKEDKTARANAIRTELIERNIAREAAEFARWQERSYDQQPTEQVSEYLQRQQDSLDALDEAVQSYQFEPYKAPAAPRQDYGVPTAEEHFNRARKNTGSDVYVPVPVPYPNPLDEE